MAVQQLTHKVVSLVSDINTVLDTEITSNFIAGTNTVETVINYKDEPINESINTNIELRLYTLKLQYPDITITKIINKEDNTVTYNITTDKDYDYTKLSISPITPYRIRIRTTDFITTVELTDTDILITNLECINKDSNKIITLLRKSYDRDKLHFYP